MQYRLGEILKQVRKFNFDYSKAEKKIYELSAKIQQTSIAQQIQASKTFHQLWGTAVAAAQKRVRDKESKLRHHREVLKQNRDELGTLESKLKSIQEDIVNTPRGHEKYVVLVTQEHELFKSIEGSRLQYQTSDQIEREGFEELLAGTREAQEEERNHRERLRLWGMVGAIIGPIIGFALSVKLNRRRWRLTNQTFDAKLDRLVLAMNTKIDKLMMATSTAVLPPPDGIIMKDNSQDIALQEDINRMMNILEQPLPQSQNPNIASILATQEAISKQLDDINERFVSSANITSPDDSSSILATQEMISKQLHDIRQSLSSSGNIASSNESGGIFPQSNSDLISRIQHIDLQTLGPWVMTFVVLVLHYGY